MRVADRPTALGERAEPGPGEVLVKLTACATCYAELRLLRGHYAFTGFPVVPGHEVTGVVTAVGDGVSSTVIGTAVGAQFLYDSCSQCEYCVRGEQILCPGKRITAVGEYAEYCAFKADHVTPLESPSVPLACAGITAFGGLRDAGTASDTRVAVVGGGVIGTIAVRYAVALGARVALVGRSRHTEEAAMALGAELFLSTDTGNPAPRLRDWEGGPDLILNAAPASTAAAVTLPGLAPDGQLVLCG